MFMHDWIFEPKMWPHLLPYRLWYVGQYINYKCNLVQHSVQPPQSPKYPGLMSYHVYFPQILSQWFVSHWQIWNKEHPMLLGQRCQMPSCTTVHPGGGVRSVTKIHTHINTHTHTFFFNVKISTYNTCLVWWATEHITLSLILERAGCILEYVKRKPFSRARSCCAFSHDPLILWRGEKAWVRGYIHAATLLNDEGIP